MPGKAQEPSARLKAADADYRAGAAALSRNDLEAARAEFEKVVQLAPSAEQGHSALGAVLLRLGRISESVAQLEKALAIQPSDISAQANLAIAYQQGGQAARALPLFARVQAAQHPLPAMLLASYARALASERQYEAAIIKMKAAIAADPQDAELQDELGSIYAQLKDWEHARQAFAAAIQLKPEFAKAHLHLGIALESEQQPGSLEEMEKANRLAPHDPVIASQLGQSLARSGQDEQAVAVLRHAVDSSPNFVPAAYQLGLALQRTNHVSEAIPLLQKVAVADPGNAEVLTNLGMALCQAQQAKEAVPVLQRAIALSPDDTTAHQNLAAAYIQLNQFDDAIEQLRAALKQSPSASQLHYDLGLALKNKDDAAGAIPELETAEKLDPTAPEAPYLLGVLYLQIGRYEDAARELNLSLKLRPENGDGWATLGSVYNNLNKLPEAVAALREATRQLPRQPDPHLTLAAVLVEQNQPAEATAERRTAADLMRANMNRQRAEVATNSANSMLKNGKLEDATAQFQEALKFDPNYAEAHLGLAAAFDQQGKTAESALERQKAQALQNASQ